MGTFHERADGARDLGKPSHPEAEPAASTQDVMLSGNQVINITPEGATGRTHVSDREVHVRMQFSAREKAARIRFDEMATRKFAIKVQAHMLPGKKLQMCVPGTREKVAFRIPHNAIPGSSTIRFQLGSSWAENRARQTAEKAAEAALASYECDHALLNHLKTWLVEQLEVVVDEAPSDSSQVPQKDASTSGSTTAPRVWSDSSYSPPYEKATQAKMGRQLLRVTRSLSFERVRKGLSRMSVDMSDSHDAQSMPSTSICLSFLFSTLSAIFLYCVLCLSSILT